MPNRANRSTSADVAEAVRTALIAAAIGAFEEAGIAGLCAEGRFEHAVGAMRSLRLEGVFTNADGGVDTE
ncbi:hypothetical protein [Turneriella parva]|uniref:Acetyltransferase n=1 Tax=Turneriella parva (strain ATCC BAA-1111 / DSM 21527 / NCTC 11395 / H) TaxID=869212 RepID=I4B2X4_TURPD|nr:hypothetical protein [Turneriella parva]AFM11631.1 hypothetical protein Turpa_0982 [Turneriella parva DSM 21527]